MFIRGWYLPSNNNRKKKKDKSDLVIYVRTNLQSDPFQVGRLRKQKWGITVFMSSAISKLNYGPLHYGILCYDWLFFLSPRINKRLKNQIPKPVDDQSLWIMQQPCEIIASPKSGIPLSLIKRTACTIVTGSKKWTRFLWWCKRISLFAMFPFSLTYN